MGLSMVFNSFLNGVLRVCLFFMVCLKVFEWFVKGFVKWVLWVCQRFLNGLLRVVLRVCLRVFKWFFKGFVRGCYRFVNVCLMVC